MRLAALIQRAVGEVEDDPRLRPILISAILYDLSFSTLWSYAGVFAVKYLGATPSQVGTLFLISAAPAGVANYVSGDLSDRVGRARLIAFSFAADTGVALGLLGCGGRFAWGFGLLAIAGIVGAPAYTLPRTLVADVVDPERREAGYATLRLAENLAVVLGPPLGGLLILLGGWRVFLFAIALTGVVGCAVSARHLPSGGGAANRAASIMATLRMILRERGYPFLLASTLLGYFAFAAYEVVLPVMAVSSYGLSASSWGLLAALNPLMVFVFQLRVTRRLGGVEYVVKLPAALLLMGASFLVLLAIQTVVAVALVVVLFVLGEMVWSPSAQTLAADFAPEAQRGAYLGAMAATTGPAWTLAPFIAFQLRGASGDRAMWIVIAGTSALAAVLGVAACRRRPAAPIADDKAGT
jgi:predicted MFS family arabinose efflux permease